MDSFQATTYLMSVEQLGPLDVVSARPNCRLDTTMLPGRALWGYGCLCTSFALCC